MHFQAKTKTSYKVASSETLNFSRIRNCKGLKVLLPGFDTAASG